MHRRNDYWVALAMLFVAFLVPAVANLAGRIWSHFMPSGQLQPIYAESPWVFWLPWILMMPLVLSTVRCWSEEHPGAGRSIAWRLAAAAGVLIVVLFGRVTLTWLIDPGRLGESLLAAWGRLIGANLSLVPLDLVSLVALSGTAYGIDRYLIFRARASHSAALALRAAKLESELARAQLAAYRGQLDPHFLFNSLNAIATLVRQQRNERAVETLAQLSGLLRLAAESIDRAEVPLRMEMDFIGRYLAIESLRFGRKLQVETCVPERLLDAIVPNLLLQPLVENAIKHGISQRTAPGRLSIRADTQGDNLVLEVCNDPAEPADAASALPRDSSRLGLKNVRARLDYLYEQTAELTLVTQPSEPTVVRVRLPYRQDPDSRGLVAAGSVPSSV